PENVDAATPIGWPRQAPERHREPDQPSLARAPLVFDPLELTLELCGDLLVTDGLHPPTAALHAGHGLADLADLAPLETEAARIDDGFLADLEGLQAETLASSEVAIGCRRHDHVPIALLREAQEAGQDLRRAARRSDRIAGDHGSLPEDAVGEEPGALEEERLVLPEGERVERVVPVLPDDGGRPRMLGVGMTVLG